MKDTLAIKFAVIFLSYFTFFFSLCCTDKSSPFGAEKSADANALTRKEKKSEIKAGMTTEFTANMPSDQSIGSMVILFDRIFLVGGVIGGSSNSL